MTRLHPLFLAFALLSLTFTVTAQEINAPDEPDTAEFITANFQLQTEYNRVLCVSGDGSCTANIEATVPCLTAVCDHAARVYPITASYATIQEAADVAQPGDLVAILPGRYAGVQFEDRGGEDGAYIVFRGYGDVVIDRTADPTKSWLRHLFYFINAHHIVIDNMVFTGADRGAGIFVSGYFSETGTFAHHIIVKDVYAHDNYSWGMHTTAASTVLVQDSAFTHSADEHGLYVSGSGDNVLIRRNIFQGNNASGVQVNPDPQTATMEIFYWLQNATGDTCGWTEDDVDFTGAAQWEDVKACYDTQGLPDLGAFIEDGISENLIIEQNVITGNGRAGGGGINLASLRHSVVRNNLVYGNDAAGITCWDNAYAEEKGLASSSFGCQDVLIANNTIVDETGNRGALILNNDARDMRVYNNIIVRDRFDAYEVANNSGSGLRSGHNYYFAQSVTDSPGFAGEENSITGFTVQEALAQFRFPTFEPYILPEGDGYRFNPDAPYFTPLFESILATGGSPDYEPRYDLFGQPRIALYNGLGAERPSLVESAGSSLSQPAASGASITSTGRTVFSLNGKAHMIRDGMLMNVTRLLDAYSPGGEDGFINISPDGRTLLIESTRFDPDCAGWSCWITIGADMLNPQVIRMDGQVFHSEDAAAISNGGDVLIAEADSGPNEIDLYAFFRQPDGSYGGATLLSGDSPYPFNRQPAISADGTRVLFDCRTEVYLGEGSSICEASVVGDFFRVVLTPDDAPEGFAPGGILHHADYAPDGSIVFEAEWFGEQLWRLPPGSATPVQINGNYNNDNSPCVLSSGNIVSLWLARPEGQGFHELKLMSPDGTQAIMLLTDEDITDGGLGCGG